MHRFGLALLVSFMLPTCKENEAVLRKMYSRPCLLVTGFENRQIKVHRLNSCLEREKFSNHTVAYIISTPEEIFQDELNGLRYEGTDNGFHFFVNMGFEKPGDDQRFSHVAFEVNKCRFLKPSVGYAFIKPAESNHREEFFSFEPVLREKHCWLEQRMF